MDDPQVEKELEPYMDKIIYRQIDIRERNLDWSTFKQDYHSDRDVEDKRTWPERCNVQCMVEIV